MDVVPETVKSISLKIFFWTFLRRIANTSLEHTLKKREKSRKRLQKKLQTDT